MANSNPDQTPPPAPLTSRRSVAFQASAFSLLFALFYLVVLLAVDPKVLYHRHCPVFQSTFGFFTRFLDRPGGPVEYLSLLLAQSCWYPWLGALALTLLAAGVCLATRGLLRAMGAGDVHPVLYCLPAAILLMLHERYQYHVLTTPAVLVALAFANVYVHVLIHRERTPWALAVFLALSAALYYLAGGMVVLFAAVCGAFEMLAMRRAALGAFCLAWGPALPIAVAACSPALTAAEAFVPLHPWYRGTEMILRLPTAFATGLQFVMLGVFPLVLVWAGIRAMRGGAGTPAPAGSWTLLTLPAFLVAAGAGAWLSYDGDMKSRLLVEYYSETAQWDRLLEAARRVPARLYDINVMHDVNRALCHSGRLLSEMLTYPQSRGAPSLRLTPEESGIMSCLKFAQFSCELGQVNLAEQWANSMLESEGQRPPILKLLIRTSILKGHPEAARTYLNVLGRNPLYAMWAEDYRRRLDADPLMRDDAEIERLRAVMLDRDYGWVSGGGWGFSHEQMLQMLLKTNPRNRMAFEYLTATYLLTGRLSKMADVLQMMDDFGDANIPRHCEEALLVLWKANPARMPDLRGRRISDETSRRYRDFLQDAVRLQNGTGADRDAALRTLTGKWGDSYFFFFTFACSEPRPGWKLVRPTPGKEQ